MSLALTLLAGVAFGLAMAAPPGPMNAVIAEESVLRGWVAGATAGLGAMTGDAIFCVLALVGVVEVVQHAPTLRAAMVLAGGLLMCYFAVDAARGARVALATDVVAANGAGTAATDSTAAEAVSGAPAAAEAAGSSAPESGDGATPAGGDASGTHGGADDALGESKGFRKALVLALTNPYQIVFWLTVGVGLLQPGSFDLLAYADWLAGLLETVGYSGGLVVETGSLALLVGFFGGIAVWITAYPAAVVALGARSEQSTAIVAGISALVLGGFGIVFVADGIGSLL